MNNKDITSKTKGNFDFEGGTGFCIESDSDEICSDGVVLLPMSLLFQNTQILSNSSKRRMLRFLTPFLCRVSMIVESWARDDESKSVVKCFPMKVALQKLPKNTFKLAITLGVEEIKKSNDKIWADVVKNAEINGFRKGNAPPDMVKQKVDPHKLESEIITDLIKTYYPQAIEEQKLSPIIDPKIELDEFNAEKDFTFSATIATRPVVTVGDYRKAIKDLYDKKKEVTDDTKGEGEPAHNHTHLSPNEVIDAITSVTTVEISDLLIEEEINKMLSRLVNQVQAIKLDMDAYLKSQNKTSESLKAEYAQVAQKNIAGELALIEVVKKEGVEATDAEVEQTLNAMGNARLKEQYSKDEYQKAYIKAIIAKNKVIWKLSSPDDSKKEDSNVKN